MKKIIASACMFAAFALAVNAQMDNVVEVENSYRPTVKDANKINVLPQIETPAANHYNVNYTLTPFPTDHYAFEPIWAARNADLLKPDKKGFFTGAYGSDGNTLGRIAYGFDLNPDDRLDVEFSTRGHKGDRHSAFDDQPDWESRFFANRLSLDYVHSFKDTPTSLLISAGLGTNVFNYSNPSPFVLMPTDKQHDNLLHASVALEALTFGQFALDAEASYQGFRQKYPTTFAEKATETLLEASLRPSYQLNDQMGIDLDLGIDHASYGIDNVEGHTGFDFTPHFYYNNADFDVKVGAYVNTEGKIAPDASIVWHAHPMVDIYADATGGEVAQNFHTFSQISPYWMLCQPLFDAPTTYPVLMRSWKMSLDNEFDQLRARAGVRFHPIDGLSADLFAGYDIQEGRAEIADNADPLFPGTNIFFADGNHLYAGAAARYTLRDQLTATASARWNHWTIDDEWEPIAANWRPEIEAEGSILARVWKELRVGADIRLQTFKGGKAYERPTTLNLGATVSYQLPLGISIYAKGDNLLGRDYDTYYQYRTAGANFLVGAAITF